MSIVTGSFHRISHLPEADNVYNDDARAQSEGKGKGRRTTQWVKQRIGMRKSRGEDDDVHEHEELKSSGTCDELKSPKEYDELKSSKGYDGLKSPKR
jgi:hypothetical protein